MAPKKRLAPATKTAPSKRTKLEDPEVITIESDNEQENNVKTEDKDQADNVKVEQKAAPRIHVPVDDYCALSVSHRVFIDQEGTIFDAALNQTNSGKNSNKFYRVQLLKNGDDYRAWTRWGRVGENGQHLAMGDGTFPDAFKIFHRKFKEKTGHKWENRLQPPNPGKYVMLERNYEADDSQPQDEQSASANGQKHDELLEVQSKLAKPVQELMKLIFNSKYMYDAMQDLDYDPRKMPLGKLSKRTISQAYETLKDLSALIVKADPADNEDIEHLSNLYLSLIPHEFGRQRPPIVTTPVMLKRELTLLDSLSDMKIADDIMKSVNESGASDMHAWDRQFQGLKLSEMTPLKETSTEFQELKKYLTGTCAETHYIKYGKVEIFRLEREGEAQRFRESSFAKLKKSDKRLLWHGSRTTNFGGILSSGLRIAPPEAPVNGYMFSKGLYLADMSTKSANYCHSYISGDEGLLLLCEAELGDPMLELAQADYAADVHAKEKGAISTWGKGNTAPRKWKDAVCVHKSLKGVRMPDVSVKPSELQVPGGSLIYNEYIAYDVAQTEVVDHEGFSHKSWYGIDRKRKLI